jgi:hypothetical protein
VQIEAYFEGKRNYFSFKMNPKGSEQSMEIIIRYFGKTRTYLEQSKILEMSKHCAVPMEKNPLWIVVPCHRDWFRWLTYGLCWGLYAKVAFGTRKPNNAAKFVLE